MIDPTEDDINRAVIYQPAPPGDLSDTGEEGVITSFNNHYVFVRYGDDKHSKATLRRDLVWAHDSR